MNHVKWFKDSMEKTNKYYGTIPSTIVGSDVRDSAYGQCLTYLPSFF